MGREFRFTTHQLRTLCKQAEALGFAHGPTPEFCGLLHQDETKHIVAYWAEHRPHLRMWKGINHGFNFDHNEGVNIRALLLCIGKGGDGLPLLCDFDCQAFMILAKTNGTLARKRKLGKPTCALGRKVDFAS